MCFLSNYPKGNKNNNLIIPKTIELIVELVLYLFKHLRFLEL